MKISMRNKSENAIGNENDKIATNLHLLGSLNYINMLSFAK